MPDIEAIKAAAVVNKDAARQKIAAARREAEDRKRLKANPVPQYVDMPEPIGDAEADSEKDLGALEQGFRKRAADENRRFAMVTDSEFWGAICFHTSEQRDAFFVALGVLDLSLGDRYFDGNAIAERLGIALPATPEFPGLKKPDPTWVKFTR